MTNHDMQTVSGRVTAISQQSIETKVWSNNLGTTTQSIEEITLKLDSLASPSCSGPTGRRACSSPMAID